MNSDVAESNEDDNAGPAGSHAWTVVAPPPVVNSATTASGTVGTFVSYAITASNSPDSYAAANLPPGLSVSTVTGAITGTPTSAGSYSISITATNAGGTSDAVVVSCTIAPPPQPAINSPTTAPAPSAAPFTYTITAHQRLRTPSTLRACRRPEYRDEHRRHHRHPPRPRAATPSR